MWASLWGKWGSVYVMICLWDTSWECRVNKKVCKFYSLMSH